MTKAEATLCTELLEWRDSGAPVEAVVAAIGRYILSLKDCLSPSHIACEHCSPGFEQRMREYDARAHQSYY